MTEQGKKTTSFNSIDQVYQYIFSIPMFATAGAGAARWGLDGIQKLCAILGNPHKNLAAIHIAGTNGKGTLAHYLNEVYTRSGYRTGVYSSPHLQELRERWVINKQMMSDEALLDLFSKYGEQISELSPTFFELTTAIAFRYFADQKVDIAIIETGLGGRLDATNIIDPQLSIITSIGFDHQQILGNSLAKIAGEKAGIIKPQRPVLIGKLPQEAIEVVKKISFDRNAPLYECDSEKVNGTGLSTENVNSELAIKTVSILSDQFPVNSGDAESGVKIAGTTLPGRFEKLHHNYHWYFDGAHNIDAVNNLKEKITSIDDISYATVVLSVMSDKASEDFLSLFSEFRKILYHPLETQRAASFADIESRLLNVELFPQDNHTRTGLLNSLKSELVIFTGSFYFYPYVKDWMKSF